MNIFLKSSTRGPPCGPSLSSSCSCPSYLPLLAHPSCECESTIPSHSKFSELLRKKGGVRTCWVNCQVERCRSHLSKSRETTEITPFHSSTSGWTSLLLPACCMTCSWWGITYGTSFRYTSENQAQIPGEGYPSLHDRRRTPFASASWTRWTPFASASGTSPMSLFTVFTLTQVPFDCVCHLNTNRLAASWIWFRRSSNPQGGPVRRAWHCLDLTGELVRSGEYVPSGYEPEPFLLVTKCVQLHSQPPQKLRGALKFRPNPGLLKQCFSLWS